MQQLGALSKVYKNLGEVFSKPWGGLTLLRCVADVLRVLGLEGETRQKPPDKHRNRPKGIELVILQAL